MVMTTSGAPILSKAVRPAKSSPSSSIPEFTTAADLLRHCKEVKARMAALKPPAGPVWSASTTGWARQFTFTFHPCLDGARGHTDLDGFNSKITGMMIVAPGRKAVCRTIVGAATRGCALGPDDLASPKRNKSIVEARQAAAWLMKSLTGQSLSSIGRHLGGRDHSTILHSCQRVQADPERFQPIIDAICRELDRETVPIARGVP